MRKSIGLIAIVCGASFTTAGHAAGGEILNSFDFAATRFLMHPSRDIMYASVASSNSVVAIDTRTLSVISTTTVGATPSGMAISNDGNSLYVSNLGSQSFSVVDTRSLEVRQVATPESTRDLEVGLDGRLHVLGESSLMQINPYTGAVISRTEAFSLFVYDGELAISPDKKTLYYADFGVGPASIYQFDVSSNNPILVWESDHGQVGSSGRDLVLSNDGSHVSYVTGVGEFGYTVAMYRTSDMTATGFFDTGFGGAMDMVFSSDDSIAYTATAVTSGIYPSSSTIDAWNVRTFEKVTSFSVHGEAYEMEVDSSGRFLFAAMGYLGGPPKTFVFDTGRVSLVPEPSIIFLFLTGLSVVGLSTSRLRKHIIL